MCVCVERSHFAQNAFGSPKKTRLLLLLLLVGRLSIGSIQMWMQKTTKTTNKQKMKWAKQKNPAKQWGKQTFLAVVWWQWVSCECCVRWCDLRSHRQIPAIFKYKLTPHHSSRHAICFMINFAECTHFNSPIFHPIADSGLKCEKPSHPFNKNEGNSDSTFAELYALRCRWSRLWSFKHLNSAATSGAAPKHTKLNSI